MKEETGGRYGYRVLSGALFAIFVLCVVTVALLAWKGGPGDGTLAVPAAARPEYPLAIGLAAFLSWQLLQTARSREKKKWVSLAASLLLLTMSSGLSFVLGEAALRAYLRRTQGFNSLSALERYDRKGYSRPLSTHALVLLVRLSPNKQLVFELRPNLKKRFGGKALRTNSDGMRDSLEYSVEKAPSTVRILGIGDSGMFGWNVEQNNNYLDLLEQSLTRRAGTYEVLNFAVPGYNTHQEVEALHAKGLKFSPDLVIVGWNKNDFDIPFFLYRPRDYRNWKVSYLYTFLFSRERYFEITMPKVLKGREIDSQLIDPEVVESTGVEGVRRGLLRLRALSEENGFNTLLFGPMNERIRNLCDAIGLEYYDTNQEIPKGIYPREYGLRSMHPRTAGHRVLAKHLEDYLDRKGWLRNEPLR